MAFMGKVRDDQLGEVFTHDIRGAGVSFEVPPAPEGPGTGLCLVMVSPDAERTMATYLGAGGLLYPDDIDANLCIEAQIVYLEGYMCGLRETEWTVSKAAAACHLKGGKLRPLAVGPLLGRPQGGRPRGPDARRGHPLRQRGGGHGHDRRRTWTSPSPSWPTAATWSS